MDSEHVEISGKRNMETFHSELPIVKKFKPDPEDEAELYNGVEIKREPLDIDESDEETDPFQGLNNSGELSDGISDTDGEHDTDSDENTGDEEEELKINEEDMEDEDDLGEEEEGEMLLGDEYGMLGVEAFLDTEEDDMEMNSTAMEGIELMPGQVFSDDIDGNELQCKNCLKVFARKSYLRGHSCSKDMQINNKALKCKYCNKRYSHKINLRLHLKLHNNPKQFQCHVCLKYLSSNSSLKVHVKTHSTEKAFKCPECDTAFNQKVHLNDHILSHHTNMRPFNCHLCNKTYVSKSVLKKHLKKHLGLYKYSCEVCTKRFFERSSLKKHMRTHTTNFPLNKLKSEEPLQCHACLTYFHFKYKLITHQMIHHGLGKESDACYQCPLCDIKFNINTSEEVQSVPTIKEENTGDVDNHVEETKSTTNNGVKSEKEDKENSEDLDNSGEEVPSSVNNLVEPEYPTHLNDHKSIFANLKITPSTMQMIISEHIKSHEYVENHMCELCYKVFESRENLMRHLKIHDDKERKRFKCEQCDKRFTSNADLNKHSNAIHQRLKLHECDLCGKNFSQRNNLKRHLEEVHRTDGMKFECYVCSKVLATSHSLKRHILIHNGPKYTCDICAKEFTRVYELNVHKKLHEDESLTNQLKCEFCGKLFLKRSNLKAHIDNNHLDYSCLECKAVGEEVSFDTKKNLLLHLKTKHKNVISNVYLTCLICFKTFLNETDLGKHMKMHSDDNQIQCQYCDKYFSRNYNLKQHMKTCTKNSSNGILTCDDEELFNGEDTPSQNAPAEEDEEVNEMLVPEIKMEMDEEPEESEEEQENFLPPLTPPIKRETDPLSMEDIIKSGEVSITPIPAPRPPTTAPSKIIQCNICHKIFVKRDSLKKHMKVFHTYISPDVIKQETGSKGKGNILEVILQEGKLPNNSAVILCRICNKTFTRKDSLRKHMKRFHIINDNTVVKKEFSEGQINRNMLEIILKESGHEIKSRIPCELCYKTFTRKDSLRKHMKIFHTRRNLNSLLAPEDGDTAPVEEEGDHFMLRAPAPVEIELPTDRIPCDLCDKSFTRKDSLKKHTRIFHTQNQDPLLQESQEPERDRSTLDTLLANASFIDHIRCELCDKSFTRKDSLKKHNKSYHGGADPRALDEHMATGSADFLEVVLDENADAEAPSVTNEILCRICNRTFTRNYNLKKHMKTVHKIDENVPYYMYDTSHRKEVKREAEAEEDMNENSNPEEVEGEEEEVDEEEEEQFGGMSNSMLEVIIEEDQG